MKKANGLVRRDVSSCKKEENWMEFFKQLGVLGVRLKGFLYK